MTKSDTQEDAAVRPTAAGWQKWEDAYLTLALGGTATSAIGALFEGMSARNAASAQQLNLRYRQNAANINARGFEDEAASIIESGQQDAEYSGLQAEQERGAEAADAGARGVANTGSEAELRASMELTRRIEARTINRNALRAANERRMAAVNSRNEATMLGVSARNLEVSSKTRPVLGALTELIRGGSAIAGQYAYQDRRR